MKMVSAAKLKAQDAINNAPYAEKIGIMQNLSATT
jgi:F0F1-type ATP synthase gamma subunit